MRKRILKYRSGDCTPYGHGARRTVVSLDGPAAGGGDGARFDLDPLTCEGVAAFEFFLTPADAGGSVGVFPEG